MSSLHPPPGHPETTSTEAIDWHEVFQVVGQAVLVLDTRYRILAANQAAARALGRCEKDLLNHKCHELFHGSPTPPEDCPMAGLLQSGRTGSTETKMEVQTINRVFLVTCNPILGPTGQIEKIIHSATDITSQKTAEKELMERERLYRAYFEDALSADYISTPDGTLLDCNPAFVEMFGFASKSQALNTDTRCIYATPTDRETFLEQLRKTGKLVQSELTLKRLNGELIHVMENTVGIFNDQGELVRFRGYLIDISAQKKLEAQLRQAAKMEAIGTLAGGIAHDFNNMLMAIQGHAALASNDVRHMPDTHERLEQIIECVENAAQLTTKLLGVARGGKYEVVPTDLNQLILKTYETFGRTRKEIRFFPRLAENLRAVEVDRSQIEQVLLNLYINAWQAMPEGGDLQIETRNVILAEAFTAPFGTPPGDYVQVSVSDTGIGMEEEVRERVFEPFFTTKRTGRGTGLGLASAYGIVQNHGGIITVDSEKYMGSTFAIFLPASDKETVSPGPAITQAPVAGGETILIVDDEEIILDVLEQILKLLGYRFMTARSGVEAVRIYSENQAEIHLVILDMIMPDLNGRETYERLKRINPQVKVLLSSGYSMDSQAMHILSQGCNGFIQKPFTVDRLAGKIRQILEPKDR